MSTASPKLRLGNSEPPVYINAGSGPPELTRVPDLFRDWKPIRVDVDPESHPEVVASIVDLSSIPDASSQAVWCSHCLEHLYRYEVPYALAEFRRVLAPGGFACVLVPDIQAIAGRIESDRLDEPIYTSAAGPVTAHDMLWGFGPAIAQGRITMAHHCGFTPKSLSDALEEAGFVEIVLRRRPNLELAAVALSEATGSTEMREKLLSDLAL